MLPEGFNDLSVPEKAQALYDAGVQARRNGQEQMAYNYFVQSQHLYRSLGDKRNTARTLVRMASLAGWVVLPEGEDMFRLGKALSDEALALYRELDDKAGMAEALCLLAPGAPYAEAIRMLEESLELARESGDQRAIAHSLERLGTHTALKDPARAEVFRQEALALYRALDDRPGIALTLFGMAIHAERVDRKRYLEEAAEIHRALGNNKRLAEVLMMMESMAYELTDYAARKAINTEALAACRAIHSPMWAAICLRRLADIARVEGDTAQAEALQAEAEATYTEPKLDPEMLAALEKAFSGNDPDQSKKMIQQLFNASNPPKTS